MSQIRAFFIRWNYLLADIYLIGFFSRMFILEEGSLSCLPWILAVSAVLAVNTLLRWRGVYVNLVIAFNVTAALAVGTLGLTLTSFPEDSFLSRVIFFVLAAVPSVHSAILVDEEPAQSRTVIYLDVALTVTALLLLLIHMDILTGTGNLLSVGELSCLGLLCSLIAFRLQWPQSAASAGGPGGGVLLLAALFLLALALAALAAAHASGISSGIVGVVLGAGNLVLTVLRFFLHLAGQFFSWLASLFPVGEEDYLLPEPETVVSPGEAAPIPADVSGTALLVTVGILAVVVLLYVLYRLRGKRWQDDRTASRPRKTRRQSHLRQHLLSLWQRFLRCLRFEAAYRRHPSTPAGLLVWTGRKLRFGPLACRENESPPAYLRRLAAACPPGTSPPDFDTLADALERQFYARTKTELPKGFCARYKKEFCCCEALREAGARPAAGKNLKQK